MNRYESSRVKQQHTQEKRTVQLFIYFIFMILHHHTLNPYSITASFFPSLICIFFVIFGSLFVYVDISIAIQRISRKRKYYIIAYSRTQWKICKMKNKKKWKIERLDEHKNIIEIATVERVFSMK